MITQAWLLEWPEIDWYLLEVKRKEKGQTDLVNAFKYHITREYNDFMLIYTDGAKEPETGVTGFGVAVAAKGILVNRRTSYMLEVYTVEMLAVLVALRWVEKDCCNKVLMRSDFSSVLTRLKSFNSNTRQDILYEVLQSVTRIVNGGGQVRFLWDEL